MYSAAMSIRRSIVEELLDTVYFSGLDNVKGPRFKKVKTRDGDAYMIPFGCAGLIGAILVHSPRKIELFAKVKGAEQKATFRSAYDAKSYICRNYVK